MCKTVPCSQTAGTVFLQYSVSRDTTRIQKKHIVTDMLGKP